MDNTRLVIVETLKSTSEDERKAYIQGKMDKWIKQQLEREGLSSGTIIPSEKYGIMRTVEMPCSRMEEGGIIGHAE